MSTAGTATESATWYYVGSFGQLGPLTLAELEELVDGGVVERETYVWNPGLPSWLPAAQIPQLAGALGRRMPYMEPPPLPPAPAPARTATLGAMPMPLGSAVAGAPPYATHASGIPPVAYAATASHPMGAHTSPHVGTHTGAGWTGVSPYGMVSDKSRVVAGLLNLLFPGIGRIYLGYSALGVIQLFATILSLGLLHIWSVVDGAMILIGQIKIDGYGRTLKD